MSTRTDDAYSIITKRPPIPSVVLVAAQEQILREMISSSLRAEGYVVLAVADEELACDLARDNQLALILLDSHFFHVGGSSLYDQWRTRSQNEHIPLLLMIDQESDIALLESNGVRADDYINKPLRREELFACVKALLRKRTRPDQHSFISLRRMKHEAVREDERVLVTDDLRIDLAQRLVLRGNHPLEIERPLLFDLLVYLVRHRGMVLTREQLLRHVWGYECTAECACDTRTVAVHMHWLREVLGDDARAPHLIQTVRGVGYRFADQMCSREREQTGRYES